MIARWVGRSLVVLAGTAAGLVASRYRESAASSAPAPAPAAAAASAVATAAPPGQGGRVLRAEPLLMRGERCRVEGRHVQRGSMGLKSFHRLMVPPHGLAVEGLAGVARMVSLPVPVGELEGERPGWKAPSDKPEETGAFDARESIFLPPPARLRCPWKIPAGASFEYSPAVVGLGSGSVRFELAATDAQGHRAVLDRIEIAALAGQRWHERRVSLEALAGQEVTLELATAASSATEETLGVFAGIPAVAAPAEASVPYNVLWFVVDSMRPDPLPSWHDEAHDAALAAAELPPLEAWLPPLPALVPAIDGLSKRGVSFVGASSAATWTRPGTLAMLSGMRSTELGLETTRWVLSHAAVRAAYAAKNPFLPVLLRRAGVRTQAFANNYWMTGYANAGIDVGFEGMLDHRDETLDTPRIVRDASRWLEQHDKERFFLFVNFNSPHAPYAPPERHLARVPRQSDPKLRAYLGEIGKDDEAIGKILDKLDALKLREKTIVVLTADHGETLSSAHDFGVPRLENHPHPTRFHHTTSIYDETVRVPLIVSLPGKLPEGKRAPGPTSTLDLAPTVLDLEGLPVDPRVSGRSLVKLAHGAAPDPERPILSEGRAARAVRAGKWRYVQRDPPVQLLVSRNDAIVVPEELYDLSIDPGERRNVAAQHPDVVARLRALLGAGPAAAPSEAAQAADGPLRLSMVFASGGAPTRALLRLEEPAPGASLAARIAGGPGAAEPRGPAAWEILLPPGRGLAAVEIEVSPPSSRVSWEVAFEGAPAPSFFAGAMGLAVPSLQGGLRSPEARAACAGPSLPFIDPARDRGVFVLCRGATDAGSAEAQGADALKELDGLLRAWGYANSATP